MKGRQNEAEGTVCTVGTWKEDEGRVGGREGEGWEGGGGNYTHRFFITVDIRQWECSLLCTLSNS